MSKTLASPGSLSLASNKTPTPDLSPLNVSASSRERFRNLVLPYAPALVLDAGGQIRYMTEAARSLLRYRPAQKIDSYFFTHVHGRNLHQVMRDLAEMVHRGKEQASWLVRLRTGRPHWHWYRVKAENKLDQPTPGITLRLSDLHNW